MIGTVSIGIVISVFLLIWTKFNISEHKSISARWSELMVKEEERENNFKGIKFALVSLIDGSSEKINDVSFYTWNKETESMILYNAEEKAIAIYQLSKIT